MKKSLKILILVIPLSLILGLWWGYRANQKKQTVAVERIGFAIDERLVTDSLRQALHKIEPRLQIVEYKNLQDLLKLLLDKNSSVEFIEISSFYSLSLAKILQLESWDDLSKNAFDDVSPDFKDILPPKYADAFLPIGWQAFGALVRSTEKEKTFSWEKLLNLSTHNQPGLLVEESCLFLTLAKSHGMDFENWEVSERKIQAGQQLHGFLGQFSHFIPKLNEPLQNQAYITPISHLLGAEIEQKFPEYSFQYLDDAIPLQVFYLTVRKQGSHSRLFNSDSSTTFPIEKLIRQEFLQPWLTSAKVASALKDTKRQSPSPSQASYIRQLKLNLIRKLSCSDEETANFLSLMTNSN